MLEARFWFRALFGTSVQHCTIERYSSCAGLPKLMICQFDVDLVSCNIAELKEQSRVLCKQRRLKMETLQLDTMVIQGSPSPQVFHSTD